MIAAPDESNFGGTPMNQTSFFVPLADQGLIQPPA